MAVEMYLLDTDILIYLSRGQKDIQLKAKEVGISNCAVSEISLFELYVGIYKSGSESVKASVEFLERTFVPVTISSAKHAYARIRAGLETAGARLENMDLLIAATAIEKGYTLVTHNARHFSRIPGLKIEDWTESQA